MGSARGSVVVLGAPSEGRHRPRYPVRAACPPFGRNRRVVGWRHEWTRPPSTTLLAPEHRDLFIGGTWREADDGRRFDVVDPADGSVLTTVADASPDEAVEALDAAVAAQADWAATAAARARRGPAPGLAAAPGPRRRRRAADEPRDGQAGRRGEGRGGLRLGVLPLVRRGGGAHPRPLDAQPGRRLAAADDQEARRAVPVHHARGTSRWRWAPARSGRPSPPAARWWSSRRPARR